jgi:hypothetical protein
MVVEMRVEWMGGDLDFDLDFEGVRLFPGNPATSRRRPGRVIFLCVPYVRAARRSALTLT